MGIGTTKALVAGVMKIIREPEKAGKGIFYILLGVMIVVMVMGSMVTRLLNCFTGYSLSENMDVTQTEIYYFCEEIKEKYEEWLDEKIQSDAESFCENNSYITTVDKVTMIDGVEVIEKVKEKRCDWYVEKYINDINNAYIMAFISTKYDIKDRHIRSYINEQEILEYLQTISVMENAPDEDSHIVYYYNNLMGMAEIIKTFFKDEQQAELFQESFKLYNMFLGDYAEPTLHESGLRVPHYFQTDFDSYGYGNGTISSSGCAPTCLAMVVSYLNDDEITPVHVVSQIGTEYYVAGQGSSWSIFSGVAEIYGLQCTDLGVSLELVKRELQAGHPVIASMGEGLFTTKGHFIVIRGMEEHLFLVNDPNKNNWDLYETDRFSMSQIMSQCKNFWSFSKEEIPDE